MSSPSLSRAGSSNEKEYLLFVQKMQRNETCMDVHEHKRTTAKLKRANDRGKITQRSSHEKLIFFETFANFRHCIDKTADPRQNNNNQQINQ